MKLICATLYLDIPRLMVLAEDNGKVRRVQVSWQAVGRARRLPPQNWVESVDGEVKFQQSSEAGPGIKGLPR